MDFGLYINNNDVNDNNKNNIDDLFILFKNISRITIQPNLYSEDI